MPNGEACSHGAIHTNMPKLMHYPFTKRAECLECCWVELIEASGGKEPKVIMDNTSKRTEDKWLIVGVGFKSVGATLHEAVRDAALALRAGRKNA
jgi:hypothetical protein